MKALFKNTDKKQLPMLAAFILFVATEIPIRVFLLYNHMNAQNGFYTGDPGMAAYAFYIVAFVGILFFVFSNLFFRQRVVLESQWRSRSICAVGSCFALSLIFDFIGQFMLFFNTSDMLALYDEVMLGVTSKAPLLIQGALALFAAFYIALYSLSNVIENFNFSSFSLFGVLPSLWCAYRLIRTFFVEVNLFNTSQRFIEMMMLVFAMMFFHNFAKYNAGYRNGVRYSSLMVFGWTAAFLSFAVSVAPICLIITGNAQRLPFMETSAFVDFFMGTFILTVLLKNNFSQRF